MEASVTPPRKRPRPASASARRRASLRARGCPVCFAAETFTAGPDPARPVSSLDDAGRCRDRDACQLRQPTLEGFEL